MNTNFTPAFPTWVNDDSMIPGMTLRDYFAAMTLPAIIKEWSDDGFMIADSNTTEDISRIAYKLADAMMKART